MSSFTQGPPATGSSRETGQNEPSVLDTAASYVPQTVKNVVNPYLPESLTGTTANASTTGGPTAAGTTISHLGDANAPGNVPYESAMQARTGPRPLGVAETAAGYHAEQPHAGAPSTGPGPFAGHTAQPTADTRSTNARGAHDGTHHDAQPKAPVTSSAAPEPYGSASALEMAVPRPADAAKHTSGTHTSDTHTSDTHTSDTHTSDTHGPGANAIRAGASGASALSASSTGAKPTPAAHTTGASSTGAQIPRPADQATLATGTGTHSTGVHTPTAVPAAPASYTTGPPATGAHNTDSHKSTTGAHNTDSHKHSSDSHKAATGAAIGASALGASATGAHNHDSHKSTTGAHTADTHTPTTGTHTADTHKPTTGTHTADTHKSTTDSHHESSTNPFKTDASTTGASTTGAHKSSTNPFTDAAATGAHTAGAHTTGAPTTGVSTTGASTTVKPKTTSHDHAAGKPNQGGAYDTDYHPAELHPPSGDYSHVDHTGPEHAVGQPGEKEGDTGALGGTRAATGTAAGRDDGLKAGDDRKVHGGVPFDVGGGSMPVGDKHEGGIDSADPKGKDAHSTKDTHSSTKDAHSTTSGSSPPKVKTMDKIKGGMKVISGKITGNEEKVELGQQMKTGQA